MRKFINFFLAFCLFFYCSNLTAKANTTSDVLASNKGNNNSITVSADKGNSYVTDDEVYLMAQVVYAESRSESFEGKVAVASVILNRLADPRFPKTIEGVIKEKDAFSCVQNGSINVIPDESSYAAVLQALKGNDPTSQAVFYYNPRTATSPWMKNVSKWNIRVIGNHVFFRR